MKSFRFIWPIAALLLLHACSNSPAGSQRTLTFNDSIAPIVFRNCSPCHRPGSAAPFNLLSYEDVKRHARTIQLTVRNRSMPPWPADPGYSHFRDEKWLSDAEIGAIDAWMEAGMPEGEEERRPQAPAFYAGSAYGKPDLVVSMRAPFPLPGDNRDRFMMMKIPIELPQDTFVRAIEIVPGNRKLAHHINGHLIVYDEGKKADVRKGREYIDTEAMDKHAAYEALDLPNDDGTYPLLIPSVTNYLPGVEPVLYPEDIGGYRLKRKSVLLLDNIHYGPSPVDTSDLSHFNFFFAPRAPRRPTRDFILGTSGISPIVPPLVIPPGQVTRHTTRYTVPETISLLSVNPHMHLLGKSFRAYALTPSGDTLRIISIPRWDFRWQYVYTFEHPLVIPAGSTLVAEGEFDNTENNPLNPFHPPRTVAERNGSMRTTDEMFQLIGTFVSYEAGDEHRDLSGQ
jgi:hypothetical protein